MPNKGSAILNPCQSWTKMEESRLWGSYFGWVHCKSPNLLQPSLFLSDCVKRTKNAIHFVLRSGRLPFLADWYNNFFGNTGESPAWKFLTNQNGALPGCTVHFDWSKVWKADTPVLPKKLQINQQNRINGSACRECTLMAIRVVEFSNGGYKIRKVFA